MSTESKVDCGKRRLIVATAAFDYAGRVFKKAPASSNLVIPPHKCLSAKRQMIGDDTLEM